MDNKLAAETIRQYVEAFDSAEVEATLAALWQLDRLIARARLERDRIVAALDIPIDEPVELCDGVSAVVKIGSQRKSWDNEQLRENVRSLIARRLEQKTIVDHDGVIYDVVEAEDAYEAVDALMRMFPPSGSSIRIRACREEGLNPDMFCEVMPPKRRVEWSASPLEQ